MFQVKASLSFWPSISMSNRIGTRTSVCEAFSWITAGSWSSKLQRKRGKTHFDTHHGALHWSYSKDMVWMSAGSHEIFCTVTVWPCGFCMKRTQREKTHVHKSLLTVYPLKNRKDQGAFGSLAMTVQIKLRTHLVLDNVLLKAKVKSDQITLSRDAYKIHAGKHQS